MQNGQTSIALFQQLGNKVATNKIIIPCYLIHNSIFWKLLIFHLEFTAQNYDHSMIHVLYTVAIIIIYIVYNSKLN